MQPNLFFCKGIWSDPNLFYRYFFPAIHVAIKGLIESLLPAASELVHIIYYKLRYEMKQCMLKEKKTLFPLIIEATAKDIVLLAEAIEPFRKTHQHIMELSQKLRQIIFGYKAQSCYSKEFKDFINELKNLENIICKWILVEEDLIFPKVNSDLAKAKFITTVFR